MPITSSSFACRLRRKPQRSRHDRLIVRDALAPRARVIAATRPGAASVWCAYSDAVNRRLPLHPKHPERVCWGCDRFCAADDLACGNGTERTQHPVELFGDDWVEWTEERWGENVAGQ